MRNNILILLVSLLFTSCGVFRNQSKTKDKSSLDSLSKSNSNFNLIDTSKVKNFSRATFYFAPGASNFEIGNTFQDFGLGLLSNATAGLAGAMRNLQDSTSKSGYGYNVNQQKTLNSDSRPPLNFPGLIAAQFENFNQQDKGLSINAGSENSTHVQAENEHKENNKTVSLKFLIIGAIIIIVVNLIIVFFVFLYLRSKK